MRESKLRRGTRVHVSREADMHRGQKGTVTHFDGDPPTEVYPDGFDNDGAGSEVWVEWDDPSSFPCWMKTIYLSTT